MPKYLDVTGQVFGRLTVIDFAGYNKHGAVTWKCRCKCGNEIVVVSGQMRYGKVSSCGCLKKEVAAQRGKSNTTHGMWNTRLYHTWQHMKQRCDGTGNAKNKIVYHDRGIRVCDEWNSNFEAFRDWAIKNGYSDDLSIDRIDGNGNYEPSNCRWATSITQANNKSTNRIIEYNGEQMSMAEAAREQGVNYRTIKSRERRRQKTENS